MNRSILKEGGLTLDFADQMIENCIGKLGLPLGLGLNLVIKGVEYAVPMAVEEPSVIAAISGAAKLVKEKGGGFNSWSSEPLMIGQVQVLEVDPLEVIPKIEERKAILIGRENHNQILLIRS